MKERLDMMLVSRGLAASREKAKAIIMSGIVYVDGQKEDKAGSMFEETAQVEVRGATLKYVSRGGLKLEKAMTHFGVELEIDEGGTVNSNAQKLLDIANANAENLYIKTDGSLDEGLELVTHPMTLEYHLNEMPWEQVLCKAQRMGYLSHAAGTCGLHVHISRLAFGCTYEQQEAAIARLLYFVEKFWAELLRFSRRTQSQMNRWAARYGIRLTPSEQMNHAKNSCAGRYTAVNLTNADTVEIRMFRGTLKLNTLKATLQMVNHLVEVAVSMSDAAVQDMSWFDFLDDITEPELIQYLKERRLYVNEPVNTSEEE